MYRRMLAVAIMAAAVATFATNAQAKDDGACPTAKAAQASGCGSCRVELKASAFNDANPAAGDVGTTTGQTTVLRATLNRGCDLPTGARIVVLREELDADGNTVGYPVRLRCTGRSCRISQTRTTDGGYRYQAVIVGCKGAKRSKILTSMWTGGGNAGTGGGGTSGGGTSGGSGGSGQATVTMTLNRVYFDPPPGDPQCTIPLPGGAGTASASYKDINGNYDIAWEWSVPQVITAGAGATLKVTVNQRSNGGISAGIGIRTPSEFGISPTNTDVEAIVPVGAPGSDHNDRSYTFNPTRPFVAGEKLYIRMRAGCTDVIYEYVGI